MVDTSAMLARIQTFTTADANTPPEGAPVFRGSGTILCFYGGVFTGNFRIYDAKESILEADATLVFSSELQLANRPHPLFLTVRKGAVIKTENPSICWVSYVKIP